MSLGVHSTSTEMHFAWTRLWAPPARVSVSEWAEANIRLPDDNNAEPGPLKLCKFQKGMLDRVMRPEVRTSVYMLASQIGKSLSIDTLLAYGMVNAPGPMLHVSPDDGTVKQFVQERFDPLAAATPVLRDRIGKGKRRGDSLRFKRFPGGFLSVVGSYNAADLAARSIRYLWIDECDRLCPTLPKEGDPVALARKRLHAFRRISKTVISSSPTVEGSRIARWYERGDQALFFCPCPDCGEFQTLDVESLVWPKGKPHLAVLACKTCGHRITDRERLDMLELGDWIPTVEQSDRTIISHHGSVLLGHLTEHAEVATEMEAAERDDEKRRAFVNTYAARPHRENEAERLDPVALKARAEEQDIKAPFPVALRYVAASVDIQGRRAEVLFLGCGDEGVQAILDHNVIPGDPSSDGFWRTISETLGRTFTLANGKKLPVALTAIDTGHESDRVAAFVMSERRLARNILPIKGVSDAQTKIPEARPVIAKMGKLRGTSLSLYGIGVDTVKTQIARRLNMTEEGPGYIYLPKRDDEDFWLSLTAEELRTEVTKSGYVRRAWINRRKTRQGGGNEVFDLLVYAVAVATRYKPSDPVKAAPAPSISAFAADLQRTINSGANDHGN